MKRALSVLVAILMLTATLAACSGGGDTSPTPTPTPAQGNNDTPAPADSTPAPEPADDTPAGELPRSETLYFGGQQWDPVRGWNPYGGDNNNAMAIAGTVSKRLVMFETPYMYNALDGKLYPLLADGQPTWNADKTELTYKIKSAAKWSDGTPVTADDAAFYWDTTEKYNLQGFSNEYITDVVAVDASTVKLVSALNDDGSPVNPFELETYVCQTYLVQKAWTEALIARNGEDATKIAQDPGEDVVYSGPYHKYSSDDRRVVFVRDDNYWGKDASMWGSLPVPKYIAHNLYADNSSELTAFKAAEIDVNQQFIENIQNLWLNDNLPISTYTDQPPYGVCLALPTMWFNFNNEKLGDAAIRKAIAMAVDYDQIIANAITNQSPTFSAVPRSLMNPTPGQQAMYDQSAVKDLQFAGNDIAGANALLDEAGYTEKDSSGIRLGKDGQKLSFNVTCPNGWSDWQAAVEIVAAAGKNIGIELTPNYPDWGIVQTVFTNPKQTEYDMFMWSMGGAGPSYPWNAVRQIFSREWAELSSNWSGNYGNYVNAEGEQLVKDILKAKTDAEAKTLYTEAMKIFLTEVPCFALMYRPETFHAVNETYWTNYPEQGDGLNIPPMVCTDGYGIAALYNITPVK